MGFMTFALVSAFIKGTAGSFTPEVLPAVITSCAMFQLFEVALLKVYDPRSGGRPCAQRRSVTGGDLAFSRSRGSNSVGGVGGHCRKLLLRVRRASVCATRGSVGHSLRRAPRSVSVVASRLGAIVDGAAAA